MTIEQYLQGAVAPAADVDRAVPIFATTTAATVAVGSVGLHEGPVFSGEPIAVGIPTQPYSLLTLSSTIQLTGVSMLAETKNVYIWDEIDDINNGNWTEIETFYS